jgi:hypothetical protein
MHADPARLLPHRRIEAAAARAAASAAAVAAGREEEALVHVRTDAISGAERGDNLAQFVIKDFYDRTSGKKLQVSCTTDINAY